jgi:hypothetical protein
MRVVTKAITSLDFGSPGQDKTPIFVKQYRALSLAGIYGSHQHLSFASAKHLSPFSL